MKRNSGKLNLFILILIILLMLFLAYEIVYVDIFHVMGNETTQIANNSNIVQNEVKHNYIEIHNANPPIENKEIPPPVNPIINNNNNRTKAITK